MTAGGCGVLVVGGGPGGYVAALRAASHGAQVLLADPAPLGGVCLHEGCIPSKILLHAAQLADEVVHAPWISGASTLSIDVPALQAWKRDVVDQLCNGISALLDHRGVKTARATVQFTGEHTARLSPGDGGPSHEVRFDRAVLATGSRIAAIPSLSFDQPGVLSSREVLALSEVPAHSVIVGAGYVGLELACLLRDLGSDVTLVDAADQVLPAMEPRAVQAVLRELQARGATIHLSTTVSAYEAGFLYAKAKDEELRLKADVVVVAVGRRPFTRGLGLDRLGLSTDEAGFLPVDDGLRTAVPHVFAIGDVTPGPALAHRAMAQGKVAGANAAGLDQRFNPAAVPGVVYTRPELAGVGLTSSEAIRRGHDVEVTTLSLAANGRIRSLAGTGTAIAVSDRRSGLLLGLHVVAPQASELAGAAALALEMGAVATDLADTIWPHPTVSEGLGELADAVLGLPLHARPSGRAANA